MRLTTFAKTVREIRASGVAETVERLLTVAFEDCPLVLAPGRFLEAATADELAELSKLSLAIHKLGVEINADRGEFAELAFEVVKAIDDEQTRRASLDDPPLDSRAIGDLDLIRRR